MISHNKIRPNGQGRWKSYVFVSPYTFYTHFTLLTLCSLFFHLSLGWAQIRQLTEVNLPRLEKAIVLIKNAKDLNKKEQDNALAMYEDSINLLKKVETWQAQANRLQQDQEKLPQQITLLKKRRSPNHQTFLPDIKRLSFEGLNLRMSQVNDSLKQLDFEEKDIKAQKSYIAERTPKLPSLISESSNLLKQIEEQIKEQIDARQAIKQGIMENARLDNFLCQREELVSRISVLQLEAATMSKKRELLTIEHDLNTKLKDNLQEHFTTLQETISQHRRFEAENILEKALQYQMQVKDIESLTPYAMKWVDFAQKRAGSDGLADRIYQINIELNETEKIWKQVKDNFGSLTKKIKIIGKTDAAGFMLQKEQKNLPNITRLKKRFEARKGAIAQIQFALMEMDELRVNSFNTERTIQHLLKNPSLQKRILLEPHIKALPKLVMLGKQEAFAALAEEYNILFYKLIDIEDKERQLISETIKLNDFIAEHVLWMPNQRSFLDLNYKELHRSLWDQFSLDNLHKIIASFYGAIQRFQVAIGFILVLFLVFLGVRSRITSPFQKMTQVMEKKSARKILLSFKALVGAFLKSVTKPLFLWLIGWAIMKSSGAGANISFAIGNTLQFTAWIYFSLKFWLEVFTDKGLATAHLHWPPIFCAKLRITFFLIQASLPFVFGSYFFSYLNELPSHIFISRIFFMLTMIIWMAIIYQVTWPEKNPKKGKTKRKPDSWLSHINVYSRFLYIGIPLSLTTMAFMGYYYTTLVLFSKLLAQLWLIGLFFLLEGLTELWIRIMKDKIQQEQIKRQPEDQEVATVQTLGLHSQQIVKFLLMIGFLAGTWAVWSDAIPAFKVLNKIELWSVAGESTTSAPVRVTFFDLLWSFIILFSTIIGTRNIPALLEVTLLHRLPLDKGGKYAFLTVTRYIVGIFGISFCLGNIGVSWSSIQWLAAAMTVGLGFGLQEIFANFVSGLIILIEQPIRIGDTVTVADVTGTITHIRMRATTITDWDKKELIVPNKEFITAKLINWSLSSEILRRIIRVGIAYGSDTDLAEKVLLATAASCPDVLADPPAQAIFKEFGDSTLNFELRVFVADISKWIPTAHRLHMEIDRAFRQHKIEIAFPQQDIHIRSLPEKMPPLGGPKGPVHK